LGITIDKTLHIPLAEIEWITAEDMRDVGLLVREQIIRRTIAGTDVHGGAFAPYSPGYAKAKAAALGAGPVNLQVSGAMLNDISIVDVRGWHDGDGPLVELGFTK
jgi:hypothetical protein